MNYSEKLNEILDQEELSSKFMIRNNGEKTMLSDSLGN